MSVQNFIKNIAPVAVVAAIGIGGGFAVYNIFFNQADVAAVSAQVEPAAGEEIFDATAPQGGEAVQNEEIPAVEAPAVNE